MLGDRVSLVFRLRQLRLQLVDLILAEQHLFLCVGLGGLGKSQIPKARLHLIGHGMALSMVLAKQHLVVAEPTGVFAVLDDAPLKLLCLGRLAVRKVGLHAWGRQQGLFLGVAQIGEERVLVRRHDFVHDPGPAGLGPHEPFELPLVHLHGRFQSDHALLVDHAGHFELPKVTPLVLDVVLLEDEQGHLRRDLAKGELIDDECHLAGLRIHLLRPAVVPHPAPVNQHVVQFELGAADAQRLSRTEGARPEKLHVDQPGLGDGAENFRFEIAPRFFLPQAETMAAVPIERRQPARGAADAGHKLGPPGNPPVDVFLFVHGVLVYVDQVPPVLMGLQHPRGHIEEPQRGDENQSEEDFVPDTHSDLPLCSRIALVGRGESAHDP